MTRKGTMLIPALAALVACGAGGCKSAAAAGSGDAPPAKERKVEPGEPQAIGSEYDRPGFVTKVVDGRLWVFKAGSKEVAAFLQHGELAKHVIRPKAGPNGMTVKAPDEATAIEYLTLKPGFFTRLEDGRLWVFKTESKELDAFRKHGELAKHIVRPKAGPFGMTVKSPDADTLLAYTCAKEGFVTKIEDGRLWVFVPGSKELAAYEKHGELAKHIVRPRAGPGGVTIKAPDETVLLSYLCAWDGFVTKIQDGRVWVFRAGSKELEAFVKHGELAKHVIRPRAGPGGVTVKAPDEETMEAYLACFNGRSREE
jgi:sugar lactone lactonase YvrE